MDFKNIWKVGLILLGVVLMKPMFAQSDLIFMGNDVTNSDLSFSYVKDVFKARYSIWSNGKSITICLPASKSVHAEKVCREIYDKSVKDVQKFWLSIVFQGKAKSPYFFDTEKEMADFILKTPGAVGVITKSSGFNVPKNLIVKVNP